jgi:two-component system nitrate/nitrite response regulator NarL
MAAAASVGNPGCMTNTKKRGRPLGVVLVDDSEPFRRAMREYLAKRLGAAVLGEAYDGEGAVALVERTAPDLVLMDVRMPGGGGLEATRVLKEAPDSPYVVLVTMGDCDHLRGIAHEIRADALLSKGDIEERLPAIFAAVEEARRPRHERSR